MIYRHLLFVIDHFIIIGFINTLMSKTDINLWGYLFSCIGVHPFKYLVYYLMHSHVFYRTTFSETPVTDSNLSPFVWLVTNPCFLTSCQPHLIKLQTKEVFSENLVLTRFFFVFSSLQMMMVIMRELMADEMLEEILWWTEATFKLLQLCRASL